MTWVVVGSSGVGLASGYMNAKSQERNNARQADISAAQAQYSPWTHITPSNPNLQATDPAGAALVGGAQGALAGVMTKQSMDKAATNLPSTVNAQSGNGGLTLGASGIDPQQYSEQDMAMSVRPQTQEDLQKQKILYGSR